MSSRKKIVIVIISMILGIGIGVLLYTNFINPVGIKCVKATGELESEEIETVVKRNESDFVKKYITMHNFTGDIPSENSEDYMYVSIDLECVNRSIREKYLLEGKVADIGKYEDMVMWSFDSNTLKPVGLTKWDTDPMNIGMYLYVKDYTDEQIEEMIKSITLEVVCEGEKSGTKTRKISLKDIDVVIER